MKISTKGRYALRLLLAGVEAAAGSGIEIRFDGTQITRASVLYRRFTLDLQPAHRTS